MAANAAAAAADAEVIAAAPEVHHCLTVCRGSFAERNVYIAVEWLDMMADYAEASEEDISQIVPWSERRTQAQGR